MVDSEPQHETDIRVPPSSEILNMVAEEIPIDSITSQQTQDVIDSMFQVAYGKQGDPNRRTMVGIAAPQVGISKRIIIIGVNAVGAGEQPELQAFINPELVEESEETVEDREGCFSTSNVCGVVSRSKEVTLKAFDRDGKVVTLKLEGFPARIAQHEVDHLNGVRFPDRITDDSKLHWVEEDEFGDYRRNWSNWTTLCPRSKWLAIKNGTLR